jgi:hypothetical protein
VPIYRARRKKNNCIKERKMNRIQTKIIIASPLAGLAIVLAACGSSPPESLGVRHLPSTVIQKETLYQAGSLAFHANLPGGPSGVVRFHLSSKSAPAGCEIGLYHGHNGITESFTANGQPTTPSDASVVDNVMTFECDAQGLSHVLSGMHLVRHPDAWFLSQRVPKGVKVYGASGQSLLKQVEKLGWGEQAGYTLDETAINLVIVKGHDGISLLVMAPSPSVARKFLATFEVQ